MPAEMNPTPRVTYHKELGRPSTPYVISVNTPELPHLIYAAALLLPETRPVPDEDINNLRIRVRRNNPSEAASFTYQKGKDGREKREITLYGDDAWRKYRKTIKTAQRISTGKERPGDQFGYLPNTENFAEYLADTPWEQGQPVAETVLLQAADRKLSGDLIHESSHFLDRVFGRHRLWYFIDGKIMDVFENVIDRFDPSERQAERIENELRNHPRWSNIVTLQPR